MLSKICFRPRADSVLSFLKLLSMKLGLRKLQSWRFFSEEEIWIAISGLNSDKAPDPDGFPLAFWSFSWDFVRNEVLGFFKEFHEQSKFVKNLNATFLVLIPKKQNVEDFKDLRPISLLGGLYKILTKVLANRIKRVMDKVISKS